MQGVPSHSTKLPLIRTMPFQGYRQQQRIHRKIVERIPKGTVIALGDASVTSRFGHIESTPNKKLANLLKANFTVFDVDEYNTSKLCSTCLQELDEPLLHQRPRKEKKKDSKGEDAKKKIWPLRLQRPSNRKERKLKSEAVEKEARVEVKYSGPHPCKGGKKYRNHVRAARLWPHAQWGPRQRRSVIWQLLNANTIKVDVFSKTIAGLWAAIFYQIRKPASRSPRDLTKGKRKSQKSRRQKGDQALECATLQYQRLS